MLYRIYTEDIKQYRDRVERICDKSFSNGFTLLSAEGHYMGQAEHALIIEYVGPEDAETRLIVDFVAKQLKHALHQTCVLVQAIKNTDWMV